MAHRPDIADAHAGIRHVFLRDVLFDATIGVYAHEQLGTQRIRVNVDLGVAEEGGGADDLARVVDYAAVLERIGGVIGAGHVQLVETLAERLAEACLDDPRVRLARVRVEKLDILPHGASAGVEVERRRSP